MFDIIEKFKVDNPPCNFKMKKHEIIFSSLAINFLSLALPIMVLQVYDRVMINKAVGTLSMLAIGVSLAIFLEFILRVARSYTTSWTGMVYEYTLAANAMDRYINADPAKLESEGAGKQLQNLASFQKLRDFYGGQTLVTLVDIPFTLLFIFLISYLTGWLVLVPVVLIGIFAVITWSLGNKLKDALIAQGDSDNKRYNFIIEALQGIHSIKSYGIEPVFKRRYERLQEESSIVNYNVSLVSTQGYTFGALFSQLVVISVVAFGAPMVINGEFTTGTLIATVLLSGRLMNPIQKTLFLWNQFQDYRIAYEKAEDMFAMPQIERNKSQRVLEIKGEIKVDNMSFSNKETGNSFSGIKLNIKAPDIISIIGSDDLSRSKMLRIIAGIEVPDSGSVNVDGVDALSLTSEELVKHVAYLSSDSIIFQGTILENLMAFDESNEGRAFEMSKLLNLDREVSLLPKGYDTQVNDGIADIVSPGVKQRISIARALLHKPKVLLFDNADKGLDRDGYNHLVKLLNILKGKVCMIIITDDFNIKRLADYEYLLEDGKFSKVTAKDSSAYDRKNFKGLNF